MASKISNIHGKVQFPAGEMNIQLSFTMDDGRYHVWIGQDNAISDVLYKNPLVGRDQPGYFETRYLNARATKNIPLISEALAAVDLDALRKADADVRESEHIEKAAKAGKQAFEEGEPIEAGNGTFYARQDAEAAAQVEAARQRRAAQADQALELLQEYMNVCGNKGQPLLDADIIHLPELWEKSNQVLIAAGL